MDEIELGERIERAFLALRDGDYLRALAMADQLVAAMPDRAVVRAVRAQALLGANSPEESFAEARQAVVLAPRDAHAHLLLALAAWRTARLGLAQESFERAIDLSNRRSALLTEYAWFMAMERGPRLAEQAARRAVAADENSSTGWAALGLAQYRLHRRAEAEASLRRSLQLNPNDMYAQSAMVTLLQAQRNDAKAEALAGLLEEHAGTEDFVSAVREEAKRRRIARILVERNVDLDSLVHEPRGYRWIGLLGSATAVALATWFINPWLPVIVLGLAALLLVVLRQWLEY